MVYVHYNNVTGEVFGAYDESCLPDIPEPSIPCDTGVWNAAASECRPVSVDVTRDPPVLVIGDPRPNPRFDTRYSKLLLVRRLMAEPEPGGDGTLWDFIKAFMELRKATDEWQAASWLTEGDRLFSELKAELRDAFPSVDIDAILRDCIYTSD